MKTLYKIIFSLLASVGCCVNVYGMQNKKREATQDLSTPKKSKTETLQLNPNEGVIYDMVPSWQELMWVASRGKLTSAFLEAYVRGRIDVRIRYWKKLYEQWKQGDTSIDVSEIPLYIQLRENKMTTSYDLVKHVFVFSDQKGRELYDKIGGQGSYKKSLIESPSSAGFFTRNLQSIYIREICGAYVHTILANIEHEITHAEQLFNTSCFDAMNRLKLLVNKDAHKYYHENFRKKLPIKSMSIITGNMPGSDSRDRESEADHQMVRFHPNLYIMRNFVHKCTPDEIKAGYISSEQRKKLIEKYLQERYQGQAYLDFMYYKEADIYEFVQGYKLVKERLEEIGIK